MQRAYFDRRVRRVFACGWIGADCVALRAKSFWKETRKPCASGDYQRVSGAVKGGEILAMEIVEGEQMN